MEFTAEIQETGPLFRGSGADRVMRQYVDEVEQRIAEDAHGVINNLMDVFRAPTGYYRSMVHTERRGDSWVLDDHGVVYGPWLDGVGSRNFPVTRFKGYKIWRRTAQMMERRAKGIAERLLDRYARRLS